MILRGFAIITIVLHNFVHLYGFVSENEFRFDAELLPRFLMNLKTQSLPFVVGDIFSFVGWLGVPVFVFLSGYGLVKKYEKTNAVLVPRNYIWHSWKKLFLLMLPAVLFFVFWNIHDTRFISRSLFSLTLLANISAVYPEPGVYWYFGLTFEVYLMYLLFFYKRSPKLLVGIFVFFLIIQIQALCFHLDGVTYWFMHNLIGWFLDFALGMLAARSVKFSQHTPSSVILLSIIAIVSGILAVLCNHNQFVWLFIHFFAIVFFIAVSLLIDKTRWIKKIFKHLGSISAFLFVMHPIARSIVNELFSTDYSFIVRIPIYLLLAFLGAYLYKYLYFRFISKFI